MTVSLVYKVRWVIINLNNSKNYQFSDKLKQLLKNVKKSDLMLSEKEIDLVADIKNITGLFIEALKFLQGQKYPTLNKVGQYITKINKE